MPELTSTAPDAETACADCGQYQTLYGPVSFDGAVIESGDFVCYRCAKARGVSERMLWYADHDVDHLSGLDDGCGCVEVWEELSDRRSEPGDVA